MESSLLYHAWCNPYYILYSAFPAAFKGKPMKHYFYLLAFAAIRLLMDIWCTRAQGDV